MLLWQPACDTQCIRTLVCYLRSDWSLILPQVEELDERLMARFAHQSSGDACPMQSVIGSITAQEIVKVSHTLSPFPSSCLPPILPSIPPSFFSSSLLPSSSSFPSLPFSLPVLFIPTPSLIPPLPPPPLPHTHTHTGMQWKVPPHYAVVLF